MPLQIKNLVCGTDFSDSSAGSVREAMRLAQGRPEAHVVLVHVTQKGKRAWPELEERLRAWVSALPEYGALPEGTVEPLIAPGRISQTLGEVAEERGSGLIVVGPLRKGLVQQVIGGIAEQLFSAATCPVLATAAPEPGGYDHILVPVDFSEGSSLALRVAAGFVHDPHGACADGAHLDLIHAYSFPGGVPSGSVRRDLEAKIKPQLISDMRALAQKSGVEDLVQNVHVAFGSARDIIVNEAERLDVDLICMSSNGGGGDVSRAILGSTASGVLMEAKRPLLVVPT